MKKHTTQQGSILVKLIVLGVLIGGAAYVKDEKGVSYLDKAIAPVKYYLVERNEAAIDSAKGARGMMQAQQDRIQEALDEK